MTIPVPPVPEQAAMLAAVALHDADCSDRHCSGPALGAYYRQARIALEAASPVVRADERERLNRDPVAEHARQFLDSDEMTELVRADPPCSRDDAMTAIGGLIGVTRMLLKLIEGDL